MGELGRVTPSTRLVGGVRDRMRTRWKGEVLPMINMENFDKVQICAGTVTSVSINKKARKPAYKVTLDFGPELGKKTSSACADPYGDRVYPIILSRSAADPGEQQGACDSLHGACDGGNSRRFCAKRETDGHTLFRDSRCDGIHCNDAAEAGAEMTRRGEALHKTTKRNNIRLISGRGAVKFTTPLPFLGSFRTLPVHR